MTDDGDRKAGQKTDAAQYRGVLSAQPVAAERGEILEQRADEILDVGPLPVPGDPDPLRRFRCG